MALSTLTRFWLPLAASWLLMAVEWPIVNAFAARLGEAKLELAALGIAISISLTVAAPIVSLLTASNALARDQGAFRLLHRFMLGLGLALSATVLLINLTPMLEVVVVKLIGTSTEIVPRVRAALWGLSLWPVAIAYRRFYQGVMIRYDYTRQVGYGTVVRLLASTTVGLVGLAWGRLNGAALGGLALGLSAAVEAAFVHWRARPAVHEIGSVTQDRGLSLRRLFRFYVPLALTSVIGLSTAPLLSWGIAHTPYPVASQAAWSVVDSQLFVLRSFGISLQEVMVALLDGPATLKLLQRFAVMLGVGSLALLLVVAFTPLAPWWQEQISGLGGELTDLAVDALQMSVLLPVLAVSLSLWRGMVVVSDATGAIAQATLVNLAVLGAVLLLGTELDWLPGASLAAVALTASRTAESAWLWHSARST